MNFSFAKKGNLVTVNVSISPQGSHDPLHRVTKQNVLSYLTSQGVETLNLIKQSGREIINDHPPYETTWVFINKSIQQPTPKPKKKVDKRTKNVLPLSNEKKSKPQNGK
tara:strand:- start:195 stop:521 length:327 start_codon:yes stop_codon:yes gene_type:complete